MTIGRSLTIAGGVMFGEPCMCEFSIRHLGSVGSSRTQRAKVVYLFHWLFGFVDLAAVQMRGVDRASRGAYWAHGE